MLQNDTWYILMDGLAINADDEPHFVKAVKEVDLFKIPEFEKNAIQKIESSVSNGETISDIQAALAENKEKVDGILDELVSDGGSSGSSDGSSGSNAVAPRTVDPENKVHFLEIKKYKVARFQKSSGENWDVVAPLVMNTVVDNEFTGLVFYSVEGEFEEAPESIAFKLTIDGVEQLDSRAKCGNSLNWGLRGATAARIKEDFH